METTEKKPQTTIRRLGTRLHRLTPIIDAAGKVIQYTVSPLRVELHRRDITQIIIGASILAIPVGFTEEVWVLGEVLPLTNILVLSLISISFIATYVYFNFYRDLFREHLLNYLKRVILIYLLTLIIVGTLLTIIDRAPWFSDTLVAIKRTVIVGFPSSLSAALSDSID